MPPNPSKASAAAVLKLDASETLFTRAKQSLPGGITRVTIESNPIPIYAECGTGAYVTDVDGNTYLDLNNNFTTLIHGHAFAPVIDGIKGQLEHGACFANPTRYEIELAETVTQRVPVAEKIRFVNTGTEAVMFAIKAARAITGRRKIAKFEGAYHGGYDWAEVSQASSPESWGRIECPSSTPLALGTPDAVLDEVVVLPSNEPEIVYDLLRENGADLACVLVDLVASRPGLVPTTTATIETLNSAAREQGFLIVDDEVLNFRQGYNGAAPLLGLKPDLVTLGKIIGGGMPIGAVAGSSEHMSVFENTNEATRIPQGGTFSANPLSMLAGSISLSHLGPHEFQNLNEMGKSVRKTLQAIIDKSEQEFSVTGLGSLFRIHPRRDPPRNYRQAFLTPEKAAKMKALSSEMLRRGVIFPPTSASALSTAMKASDLDRITGAFKESIESMEIGIG